MLQLPEFQSTQYDILKKFSKNSKIAGIIFILLGLIGIFFPAVISITSAIFFGWILLFSGFMAGYHTFYTNKSDWMGWLKTFVLIFVGALTIIKPFPGVATLGIFFAFYFAMDSFSSFALAFASKGLPQRWMIFLNGFISAVLSFLMIADWPFSSLIYVGLFIGISLFMDGVILLTISKTINKLDQEG